MHKYLKRDNTYSTDYQYNTLSCSQAFKVPALTFNLVKVSLLTFNLAKFSCGIFKKLSHIQRQFKPYHIVLSILRYTSDGASHQLNAQ